MAGNLPACGEIVQIEEISQNLDLFQGKSIRVTGSLAHHDFNACNASLSNPRSKQKIQIDTQLVEPFEGVTGSLYQFIGEIERSGNEGVLKARVVRSVDGLDLTMYHKAVDLFNNYFTRDTDLEQEAAS